jgi:hypothetical protein
LRRGYGCSRIAKVDAIDRLDLRSREVVARRLREVAQRQHHARHGRSAIRS